MNGIIKSRLEAFIFLLFIILPYLFLGLDIDYVNYVIAPGDANIEGIPNKYFATSFSFWNPYVQCGTATVKNFVQALYLPGLLAMKIMPNALGYNIFLLFHYSLAGYGTYLFIRANKLHYLAAIMAGVIFMFSGFMASHKGHYAMITAAAWLPVMMFFIERFYESQKRYYLILIAMVLYFQISADYPAVVVYSMIIAIGYFVYKTYFIKKEKFRTKTASLVINMITVLGIAILLSSIHLFAVLESLPLITRQQSTYDFFASYSFPLYALPLLIFPNIFGSHTPNELYTHLYFGPNNLTELAGYIGVLPLFFVLVAVILVKQKYKVVYFWITFLLFGFFLVLGDSTPFYRFMYEIPIYNKFRVPARNWFEVHFIIAVLSAYSTHYLLKTEVYYKDIKVLLKYFLFILITIGSMVWIGRGLIYRLKYTWNNDFNIPQEQIVNSFLANTEVTSPAIYIPFLMIIVAILFILLLKKFSKNKFYWSLLIMFIFIDLYSYGHYHDRAYSKHRGENSEISKYLKQHEKHLDRFRVLSLDNDYRDISPYLNTYHEIQVANFYGPIWLKNYKMLTDFLPHGITNSELVVKSPDIFSLLGIKYLFLSSSNQFYHYFNSDKVLNYQIIKRIYQNNREYILLENTEVFPRVRFVENIHPVSSAHEAIQKIRNNQIKNLETDALVEGIDISERLEIGKILNQDFSNPEKVSISVSTPSKSFLVLSDTYYPGWKAYINNKETKIFRVYGNFRGILIPEKGEFDIVYTYQPRYLYLAGFLWLLAVIIMGILVFYDTKKTTTKEKYEKIIN